MLIDNININVIDKSQGKPIVLLHGWGQNIEMMDIVGRHLEEKHRIVILDFPGFGKSDEPQESWGVDEYVDCLHKILTSLDVVNPIIIGHSFGCRVAIKYANLYPVEKMVFTGAAGIKPKQSLSTKLRIRSYKASKKLVSITKSKKLELFVKSKFGSSDYKSSSEIMRQTLVKVVNEDLKPYLSNITCPVILFWGKQDDATLISDGYVMESLLKDAALIAVEGTHYAYVENLEYFVTIIKEFIK